MGITLPSGMSGGPDVPSTPAADNSREEGRVVKIVQGYKTRSALVRRLRRDLNKKNWDFWNGHQDWSHKQPGQARIFLPDLPVSIQQAAAEIENSLISFANWFSIETPGGIPLFDGDTLRLLVQHTLDRLDAPGNVVETAYKFPTWLADAIVIGIIESEITAKVYGVDGERCVYMLESTDPTHPEGMVGGLDEEVSEADELTPAPRRTYERLSQEIKKAVIRTFRLGIDLIPYEDSFPDPSPLNLYHIHSTVRHISELRNNPDYDPAVIDALGRGASEVTYERDKAKRSGQLFPYEQSKDPSQVTVDECWGDLVDSDGILVENNCLVTIANGRLLRPPVKNPFWHGYRPIVRAALVRTPLSAVHKAVMDHAVPVAEAENEVTSLLVDGGAQAVWGTRQVRPEYLQNPSSISKGIPAGFTAVIRKGVPPGVKFMERVDEGTQVPSYGLEVANRLGRARQTATYTSDLKIGQLPPRQVKATEIVESQDASASLFENLAVRLEENLIEPILQLSWLTMWQHIDDFSSPELVQVLGEQRALVLQQLTPEERFYLMANNVKFKVRGLRNLLSRLKDFQKITTILTSVSTSPMIAMAWNMKYDTARLLEKLVRSVNIDPTELEYRPGEGPAVDPAVIAQPGQEPGAAGGDPNAPPMEGSYAPPNAMGFRGGQV